MFVPTCPVMCLTEVVGLNSGMGWGEKAYFHLFHLLKLKEKNTRSLMCKSNAVVYINKSVL